jgi:hypothetical protein
MDRSQRVSELVHFITAAIRATQREELPATGLDLTLAQFMVMCPASPIAPGPAGSSWPE